MRAVDEMFQRRELIERVVALERQVCNAQPRIDLHVTCLRIEYSSAKKNEIAK